MEGTPEEELRQRGGHWHQAKRSENAGSNGAGVHGAGTREAGAKVFRTLTPKECAAEAPRDYRLKGLLSPGDHAMIIGEPGSGKSVIAPYIGYCIALGLPVFGRRTKTTTVLYLAAEDGAGMKMRIRALFELLGDAPNFHLQPLPIDLISPGSPDIEGIRTLIAKLRPGVVIIDTMFRAFPGLKENDPDGMGIAIMVSRGFTTICDSTVLTIHHPPKGGKDPRGHGSLNGDLDVTFILGGTGSEPRTITLGKNRNGPSDQTFGFNVGQHFLGRDPDGDPITAPVAEIESGPVRKKVSLTPTQRSAVTFLADILCDAGKPLPTGPGYALDLRGVQETAWRDACESRRLSTADEPKDRKRVFRKVYADLRIKGIIGANDGWVWLTAQEGGGLDHPIGGDPQSAPPGDGDWGDYPP